MFSNFKTIFLYNKHKNKILPLIKAKTEVSANSIKIESDAQPVFQVLFENILCFYVIDKGDKYEYLRKKDLPKNLSIIELHRTAIENLKLKVMNTSKLYKTDFGGCLIVCGDYLESCLILIDDIWDNIKELFGSNIIFSIPAKDLIMFVAANDQSAISGLKDRVEEIYKVGDSLISKHLYYWQNGEISIYI